MGEPRSRKKPLMIGWCVLFRYNRDEPWRFWRQSRGGLDALIHLTRRKAQFEARSASYIISRGNVRVRKFVETPDAH